MTNSQQMNSKSPQPACHSQNCLAIPEEVLLDIAQVLADSGSRGTLAAFAVTSRRFYDLLIPSLYRELNMRRGVGRKKDRAKQAYSIGPFALLASQLPKFYSQSGDAGSFAVAPVFDRQTRLLSALTHTVRLTLYDTQLFCPAPRVERLAIAHLEETGGRLMPALKSIVILPPYKYDQDLPPLPAAVPPLFKDDVEGCSPDDGTLAEAMLIACSPQHICIRAPIAISKVAYQPFLDADGNLDLDTPWARRSHQFGPWLTEWGKRNLPAMLTWHRVPLITVPIDESHPMRQTRVEVATQWEYRGPPPKHSEFELTPAEEDWRISARAELWRAGTRAAVSMVDTWLRPEWTFLKSTAPPVPLRLLVVNAAGHVPLIPVTRARPLDELRKGVPWSKAQIWYQELWEEVNNHVINADDNEEIANWEHVKELLFFGTAKGWITCDGCRNS